VPEAAPAPRQPDAPRGSGWGFVLATFVAGEIFFYVVFAFVSERTFFLFFGATAAALVTTTMIVGAIRVLRGHEL
jgi:hypothetical protein